MGELGDVVPIRERAPDLLAEVEDHDEDEGEGDLAFVEVREGGEEDHHEDDARGAEEDGVREEEDVEHSGDEGGGGEEDELSDELYDQALATVSEMRAVSISMLQRKMRI